MSNIVSCGIDIIEIERVKALYERHGDRFLKRVYTSWERGRLAVRADPAAFLAGRFAAKEAVLKVLGCGIMEGVPLTELEIGARESGEPLCVLSGEARRRADERGIGKILVSISHCDKYAVAQAVGLGG